MVQAARDTGIAAGSAGCRSRTCNSSGGVERCAGARCGIAAIAAGTGAAGCRKVAGAITTDAASTNDRDSHRADYDRDMFRLETERLIIRPWEPADRDVFVAEDADGTVVGSYSLRANQVGGGAHVANCSYIVAASAGGRGVGRALLVHACEAARRSGCAAVDLEVDAAQARAANLYLRLGFLPHQRARWVRVLR